MGLIQLLGGSPTKSSTSTGGGIGGAVGRFIGGDITPGFNLASGSVGDPYVAATGTNNVLGLGFNAATLADQARATGATHTQPTATKTGSTNTGTSGSGSGLGAGGGSGSGSGGGSTYATQAVDPAYGLYAGQAQTALERALNAYNGTQAATNQQYAQHQNELNSALGQATQNYNQGLTTQDQTRLTNDNTIRQGANQGYQSLLRMLGSMGAGGGSEAQYLVPQLVGQNLSQQLGGADQTAAQNKVALTSNFNDYTTNEKKQQQQLNDWKSQQLGQADATYNDTKAKLSNLLSALNAHADTAANLGSQVNNIDAQIPTLLASHPTYDGNTPVYTAPQLSTFEAQANPQAQIKANTPNANSTTPYLSLLLGQDQKKQQVA